MEIWYLHFFGIASGFEDYDAIVWLSSELTIVTFDDVEGFVIFYIFAVSAVHDIEIWMSGIYSKKIFALQPGSVLELDTAPHVGYHGFLDHRDVIGHTIP